MQPARYLETDYYEHWLHSLETWCIKNGSLTEEEIDQRMKKLAKGAP
jgi:hypothetical protein